MTTATTSPSSTSFIEQLASGIAASDASLSALLNPRSIALIGASDRSAFSRSAWTNLQSLGFPGSIYLVSRSGGIAHGRQTLTSCRAIRQPVDVALVMVPIMGIADVLRDLADCGTRYAVLLAGGFAEVGDEGRELQDGIAATARGLGITLLGPNCLGYINFTARAACWTSTMRTPALAGPVSLVSQSGAIATFISHFAHQQGVGLHCVVSTGNESMLDLSTVADHLLDDPNNRVIALFIETVRDPKHFRAMAARALRLGKPLVALKVGRSDITVQAAQSHTGAMVGDDSVFDGVCRQYGIVRVRSMEELVITADLMAKLGPLSGHGVGFMSMSGGMGELGADYAHLEGVHMPRLAPTTLAALREVLPSFATPSNPLDLTGGAINDPRLFTHSLRAMAADPGVALTVCIADVPTGLNDDWASHYVSTVEEIGRCIAELDQPVVVISNTIKHVSDRARNVITSLGLPYVAAGADLGMLAVRHALAWSRKFAQARTPPTGPVSNVDAAQRPKSEREATLYLASFGVPVIPSALATTAAEAIAAAAAMDGPVVLKIASPDIAHKTEVGGVRLNLHGDAAVGAAFDGICASVVAAAPQAHIDGVLVSPMRRGGVELFVGVRHDPQWGHVVAVGLGGVWIEALQDASLRLLPVSVEDVTDMLGELRGARLLEGFRGATPVNTARLAEAVARIGDAALALGSSLDTLEVNPLLADGERIEALDALATYRDHHLHSTGEPA